MSDNFGWVEFLDLHYNFELGKFVEDSDIDRAEYLASPKQWDMDFPEEEAYWYYYFYRP